MPTLKIISDSLSDIYIDGEFISSVEPGKLHRTLLEIGEYWVQVLCKADSTKKYEEIVSLQFDKVIKADFNISSHDSSPASLPNEINKAQSISPTDAAISTDLLIKVKKGSKSAVYDMSSKSYISNWYDSINSVFDGFSVVSSNGKFGIIDTTCKEVVPCRFDWLDDYINDGYVVFKENGKYGLIDVYGNLMIPASYKSKYDLYFSDGLSSAESKKKYGYIDFYGRTVIPFIYDAAYGFKNGYATVSKKFVDYIIDRSGNIVLSPKEGEYISNLLTNGNTIRVTVGQKNGLKDVYGNFIIPCRYDNIVFPFEDDGFIKVELDGKYGFYDLVGKEIVPCIYDEVRDFDVDNEVTFVRLGNKYALIDSEGDIITPFIYDSCNEWPDFSEGLDYVERNGKFGFINTDGEEVIPCIYTKVNPFINGFAAVKIRNKWNLIDKQGDLVMSDVGKDAYAINENLVCLKKDRKFGITDWKGNEILPFVYDDIDYFH